MKEVRANEDDNTYSQRLETEKNRRSIEYLNETSDHYDDRMAKKIQKNNLMSKLEVPMRRRRIPIPGDFG